jgi:DNA-binding PadR family transcriptional regulator
VNNIFELTESEEEELKEAMEILKKYYEEIWLRNLVNLHRA